MFNFLKKKKKDKEDPEEKAEDSQKISSPDEAPDKTDGKTAGKKTGKASKKSTKKKKRFSLKRLGVILLVLLAVGGSAFVVYKLWFSPKNNENSAPVYKKIELVHVNLPEEMRKFSFDYFPELYVAMLEFNREMDLFEKEIERIEQIALKYPDQKKIAQKEKKTWGKAKNTLKKSFLKVEKPIKETYVLFRVNKELGLVQIEEKNKELTQIAQDALVPAQQMTQQLKQNQVAPKGLIKGTLYNLKKKFL